MKELVVISGKGGAGKTSIVASLASLAENKVMADCDVDAADLHLVLSPEVVKKEEFTGSGIAAIDIDKCVSCGQCLSLCRFNAISDNFEIDPLSCEGCGVCAYFCTVEAIIMKEKIAGEWYISKTAYGPMTHARLGIAEGTSGKLVSIVRREAARIAKEENLELTITDGSPGIGCPVIASITGASLVLIVTEPTISGIHDMKRAFELTRHFKIKAMICINKYDLNSENVKEIEEYCKENGVNIAAKIPYDIDFTKAQLEAKSIVEYSDGTASGEIKKMWERISGEI